LWHVTTRPFRWMPAARGRHAIPDTFPLWGPKTTLCGLDIVIDHQPTEQEWGWPTCWDCNAIWKAAEVSV
jgi:hypothetical protein